MPDGSMRKWEIALVCSVAVSLLWSLAVGPTSGCAWWGTVYPELTPPDGSAQAVAAAGAEGVVLRFRLLEWLEGLLCALGLG